LVDVLIELISRSLRQTTKLCKSFHGSEKLSQTFVVLRTKQANSFRGKFKKDAREDFKVPAE
jgi:hypothetical protein